MVERFDYDANYLTALDRKGSWAWSFMRLEKLLAAVWPSRHDGRPQERARGRRTS